MIVVGRRNFWIFGGWWKTFSAFFRGVGLLLRSGCGWPWGTAKASPKHLISWNKQMSQIQNPRELRKTVNSRTSFECFEASSVTFFFWALFTHVWCAVAIGGSARDLWNIQNSVSFRKTVQTRFSSQIRSCAMLWINNFCCKLTNYSRRVQSDDQERSRLFCEASLRIQRAHDRFKIMIEFRTSWERNAHTTRHSRHSRKHSTVIS